VYERYSTSPLPVLITIDSSQKTHMRFCSQTRTQGENEIVVGLDRAGVKKIIEKLARRVAKGGAAHRVNMDDLSAKVGGPCYGKQTSCAALIS
jgi:hypothetical protein